MRPIPKTRNTLLLRTSFRDDAAWDAFCAAIQEPVGDFQAYVSPCSDRAFEAVTPAEIAGAAREAGHLLVLVADEHALADPERAVLVIDVVEQDLRTFRVIPKHAWSVENNLSLANMDFDDFAEALGADGVFRGFDDAT